MFYLLSMDSLKCVLGHKENEIKSNKLTGYVNANDYYKLWTINEYSGPQKYREINNVEEGITGQYWNPLVSDYSQKYAMSLIGNRRIPFLKLISDFQKRLSVNFEENFYKNLPISHSIHPESAVGSFFK